MSVFKSFNNNYTEILKYLLFNGPTPLIGHARPHAVSLSDAAPSPQDLRDLLGLRDEEPVLRGGAGHQV